MVWEIQAAYEGRYSPGVRHPEQSPDHNAARGGQSFFDGVVRLLNEGRPMRHPERMPTTGRIPKPRKRFYAVMRMMDQLAVTEELRDFIEEWEPGVHEFFPIRLYAKSTGEEMPVTYHILNVCNRIPSIVLDERLLRIERYGEGPDARHFWFRRSGKDPLPVFNSDAIGGSRIWRDEGSTARIFASDPFVEAMEKAGFKGWDKVCHYDEE